MNKRRAIRQPNRRELFTLRLLILFGLGSCIFFCAWLLKAEYVGHPVLYFLLLVIMGLAIAKKLNLWYYYVSISVPETPTLKQAFTVDILTTYFPGEPYEMVVKTLEAIQRITYPHTTYLCDEANDPYLIEECRRLGVIHVTRNNRTNAKAGNINNALQRATGEICLILDPDHVPFPDFLDCVVPHFQDPEIGFVQVVQSYYNKFESLVAKGAAQQTFHFYGPMMMSMNTYGCVNAIGANCTFRRKALDGIGGHAPGLAEDMHTAMLLYAKGWKSTYIPRVLARGLVPSTLYAYYRQQMKWTRGTMELILRVFPKIVAKLTFRQRIHYLWSSLHYMSGFAYLAGFLLPVLALLLTDTPWHGEFTFFLLVFSPMFFSSVIIRYYVQKWLIEEDENGFHIVGGLLELSTWWVFVLGFLYSIIGKEIPYLPTPKGNEDRVSPKLILPNLVVGGLSLMAIGVGLPQDFTPFSLLMAFFCLVNVGLLSFSLYIASGSGNQIGLARQRMQPRLRGIMRRAKWMLLRSLQLTTQTVRRFPVILILLATLLPGWLVTERHSALWEKNEAVVDPLLSTKITVAEKEGEERSSGNRVFSNWDALAVDSAKAIIQQALSPSLPISTKSVTTHGRLLLAVGYRKVERWSESRYSLSRDPMAQDFYRARQLGFNALMIRPPGVFRYNCFLLAKEAGLDVLLKVPVEEPESSVGQGAIGGAGSSVVETIKRYCKEENLWGYVIDCSGFSPTLPKGEALVKNEYSSPYWRQLQKILSAVKEVDPTRPIILELPTTILADQHFWKRAFPELPAAFLSFGVTKKEQLLVLKTLGLLEHDRVIINVLTPSIFPRIQGRLTERSLFAGNLQNEWQAHRITYDGVLDFQGRIKADAASFLPAVQGPITLPELHIIPPATPLRSGQWQTYHAVVQETDELRYASTDDNVAYEWSLIKKSPSGFHLAFRKLPPGPTVRVEIPEDYQRYELRLTVTDGEISRSTRVPLNIPLRQ